MNKLIVALCALTLFTFSSCTKDAGFGGLASVSGKVYAFDYTPNSPTIPEAEGYTPNMKVVLSVKGSGKVLKETRTDLDGSYKFEELRKGTYQVWTFTECDKCTDNEEAVVQEFEIESTKQEKLLEDFVINI